jgi:hypothetical protein
MKRITILIPVSQADSVAQWLFEKTVKVLLSFSQDEFFDSKVRIICGVPDEVVPEFQTKFSSQIKN